MSWLGRMLKWQLHYHWLRYFVSPYYFHVKTLFCLFCNLGIISLSRLNMYVLLLCNGKHSTVINVTNNNCPFQGHRKQYCPCIHSKLIKPIILHQLKKNLLPNAKYALTNFSLRVRRGKLLTLCESSSSSLMQYSTFAGSQTQ